MSTSALSLTKEGTPLVDNSGSPADAVDFSIFWRADTSKKAGFLGKVKGAPKVDLDLTVVCYNGSSQPVAVCKYKETPFGPKTLFHTGDTKSDRSGDEQSEKVEATLSEVPDDIKTLAVVINSFGGHTLNYVNQLRLLIEDRTANGPVKVREKFLPILGAENSALIAVIKRDPDGGWTAAYREYIFRGGRDWRDNAVTIAGQL